MNTADTRIAQLKKVISDEALSSSEIEHRLAHAIDAEYAKSDIDAAFIQACEDLLWQIRAGEQPFTSANQQYTAAMRKHMKAERKHAVPVFVRRFAIICAAILLISIAAGDLLRWEWLTTEMINDNQQFLIAGHKLDVSIISESIATHVENDYIVTEDWQECIDFIGFEPALPALEQLNMTYKQFSVFYSDNGIMLSAYCPHNEDKSKSTVYNAHYLMNKNDVHLSLEQSAEPTIIMINGIEVYIGKNIDHDTYFWIDGHTIHYITGPIEPAIAIPIVEGMILASQ